MELARITLNPADWQARRDLADPYEMHSTLARAFAPAADAPPEPFLWRLEPPGGAVAAQLLVQSAGGGRWEALRSEIPGWAMTVDLRAWNPAAALQPGLKVRFRLRANPTVTRDGKRRALLKEPEQRQWLERQFEKSGIQAAGFEVVEGVRLNGRRRKEGGAMLTVNAVLYEGSAVVLDAAAAVEAVSRGLGHARMLGLGLLSLAPLRM
jgi:CRISPR system Cascade subunit CasE